jgi:hypothetical protein
VTDLFAPHDPEIPGIEWDEKYLKWRSFIVVDGKEINLGRYNYLKSAVQVRDSAEYRYSEPAKNVKDLFST